MTEDPYAELVTLGTHHPIWDRFFWVAPLVVIGTREVSGEFDLAPKHMAGPLGWQNYFSFVCTPKHATYRNAQREKAFTVSYPRPDQVVMAGLAATPRCDDGSKATLQSLPTIPAQLFEGVLLKDSYVYLECELDRIIDDFGVNSIVIGKVLAAHVHPEAARREDRDDQDVVRDCPVLAYLSPGRFAAIRDTHSFPLPEGFSR
jgi:flavin reductase (DIM6/NTAB) family NADH-FMN oxidoreductase RutF